MIVLHSMLFFWISGSETQPGIVFKDLNGINGVTNVYCGRLDIVKSIFQVRYWLKWADDGRRHNMVNSLCKATVSELIDVI